MALSLECDQALLFDSGWSGIRFRDWADECLARARWADGVRVDFHYEDSIPGVFQGLTVRRIRFLRQASRLPWRRILSLPLLWSLLQCRAHRAYGFADRMWLSFVVAPDHALAGREAFAVEVKRGGHIALRLGDTLYPIFDAKPSSHDILARVKAFSAR